MCVFSSLLPSHHVAGQTRCGCAQISHYMSLSPSYKSDIYMNQGPAHQTKNKQIKAFTDTTKIYCIPVSATSVKMQHSESAPSLMGPIYLRKTSNCHVRLILIYSRRPGPLAAIKIPVQKVSLQLCLLSFCLWAFPKHHLLICVSGQRCNSDIKPFYQTLLNFALLSGIAGLHVD